MEFEWDKNKAAYNLSKHSVSFDEASTVFDDTLYVDFYDPDHSYRESEKVQPPLQTSLVKQRIDTRFL